MAVVRLHRTDLGEPTPLQRLAFAMSDLAAHSAFFSADFSSSLASATATHA